MENLTKKLGSASLEYKLITPKHNLNQVDIQMSLTKHKLNQKTPSKTPLKLITSSSKKKTPSTKTNDRYIPNRVNSNIEASYHLLLSSSTNDQENNLENHPQQQQSNNLVDNIKRRLINDTFQTGVLNEKGFENKILNFNNTKLNDSEQSFLDNLKLIYNNTGSTSSNNTNSLKKTNHRHVLNAPEKILDAPDFKDDFYLNLIDWSSSNNLAVALNKDMYIWNASTKEISQLFSMDENSPDYITSCSWIQKGNVLAIGNSKNIIELWDINKQVCLRQMKSHVARIGSLAWNLHILSSGSRSGDIHNHDVRIAKHHIGSLKLHNQEVCGLKWSLDGRYLASGANDNLVGIWDGNLTHDTSQPMHTLREHTAAVKGLAWCPWQSNILATGGGTADGFINIWNIYNGNIVQKQDTKSQISCLLWSKNYKELISSHGYQQNQLSIWKYPDMSKVCDLMGHTNRVLKMALSPDEEIVASVGADETLRLWKCFAVDDKFKKSKDSSLAENKSHTSLTRSIR